MSTEPDVLHWFKSSYSSNGGNCLEVADVAARGAVLVRDSKDLNGPVLGVSASAFAFFAAGVKGGRLAV
ncbi:DUF397 domain-containing protein [Streptomyces roseirectus]|uniref:DUF397 domain-containing protein n=1 Tax=Streptomyces roseirectus TaxID=2768066 RepID=A0A7H0ICF0_9ACTN|nr:DUF397 domain-containing protein [Streptomyces roseirectus]QNP70466.1 DUF397 domain-containing protein [Streptomyces roseirectus]